MLARVKRLFLSRAFLVYAIIGVSGVVLDFVIYTLLVYAGVLPVLASAVSISIAIINNFIWNAIFNFRTSDRIIARFIAFYLIGCVGMLLSAVLIFVLHDLLGLGPIVAKVITIVPVTVLQYLLNRTIAFGDLGKFSAGIRGALRGVGSRKYVG